MDYKCDIILLSYESPKLLKRCVQSVMEHTKVKSRLIIVDNGSKDPGVAQYIQSVHGNENITVEKVFSERNAGFAAGMNKGMRMSDAPFLCLLNNDCIVTDGWLAEMINVAVSSDQFGLVNPQSNTFGSYPDGKATINDHAALLRDREGEFVELGHAIGFACLIKEEVVERVGYLDESYEGVCYEDTDFAVRAHRVGFASVMAEAAYVYHAEQASRKDLEGKKEVYRKNKALFERRWGTLLRVLFLDAPVKSGGRVSEDYETLRALAGERAIIEMWVKNNLTAEEIFEGFRTKSIVRHADIAVRVFMKGIMPLTVLWKVLTKKKKYDAVILREGLLSSVLRILKPFHKAEILYWQDGSKVTSGRGVGFDLRAPSALAEFLRKRKQRF